MSVNYRIRRVNNKRFPEEKPSYSVSLVSWHNTNREEIAIDMSERSSFSAGDLTGLIDNLVLIIADELAMGNTVTLDGLGTFSISATLKDPSRDPDRIDGKDILLNRVCFKPAPAFKDRIRRKLTFRKLDPEIKRWRQQDRVRRSPGIHGSKSKRA